MFKDIKLAENGKILRKISKKSSSAEPVEPAFCNSDKSLSFPSAKPCFIKLKESVFLLASRFSKCNTF